MVQIYEFEDVVVDLGRYEVRRAGEPVPVEPQVFEVLALLVTNHHRMLEKTEILDSVWGDQFVSESALSTRIRSARQAVGDNGRDQRIIRTVHGRGFRIVADVNEVVDEGDAGGADDGDRGPVAPSPIEATPVPTPVVTTNLPRSRDTLIGRTQDTQRILEQVGSSDVVSIVGPGGVGKTTLALAVGRELLADHPGGVWFCGLASVVADQVAAAVLDSLTNNAGSGLATTEQIVDRLGHEPIVLILDNCEQVIESAAKLTEELVALVPNLSVLVTSREALDIRGERVVRIEGLEGGNSQSPAVELFLHRARDVTDVTDDSTTRELATQITARLDGLPLAIELAAPQLASLTMTELLAALDNQLPLLRSRRRYDSRQAAMDDTIAWSFDLLTEAERTTLLELGAFLGAFTLDAAIEVCSGEDVNHHMHRLVEQSVVTRVEHAQTSRYRLLEPIRQFATRRIDPEAATAADERHARYFAHRVTSLAADMRGPSEPAAAESLTREWLDFGKALAWGRDNQAPEVAFRPLVAMEFHLMWQLRIEAFMWLEQAAQMLGDQGERQPAIDFVRAIGGWAANDLERSQALLQSAVDATGWSTAMAYLRFYQAFALTDFETLMEAGDQVWELAKTDDDETWLIAAAAFKLISRAISDPLNPEVPDLAAEVDRQIELNDWPTGLCLALLSHLTRTARAGLMDEAGPLAETLERVATEAHVPWFPMTAALLTSNFVDAGDPIVQLETASQTIRTAVSAGEMVQMPAFLRTLFVALEATGQLKSAALILGLIPTVHGLGEDGVFSPGYDDAIARLEDRLPADDMERLMGQGRRLSIDDVADMGEEALEQARTQQNNLEGGA